MVSNVLVSVSPTLSKLHEQVYEFGKKISEYLLPRTNAYHEIWLDKKLVAGNVLQDHEPRFRDTFYLPRKVRFDSHAIAHYIHSSHFRSSLP